MDARRLLGRPEHGHLGAGRRAHPPGVPGGRHGSSDLTAAFELDQGRIRLADAVYVYLERTIAPAAPLPAGVAPRAYGLSPAAVSPSGSVLAAVARGEAVWLGFQAVDPARPAVVRVRVDREEPLDALTGRAWEDARSDEPRNYLQAPPDSRLPGLRLGKDAGFLPFAAGEHLTVLSEEEPEAAVNVELVSPETFQEIFGITPEPLDPEGAYKGWRLP